MSSHSSQSRLASPPGRHQRWASFVLNTLLHCMEGSRYKSLSCQVCGRGTQDNTIDSISSAIYLCVPTVAHKHTLYVYLLLSKKVSEGNNCKIISACSCTNVYCYFCSDTKYSFYSLLFIIHYSYSP